MILSCNATLPSNQISGCVDFNGLDGIILRWKLDIFRLDVLNEAINKWKGGIGC